MCDYHSRKNDNHFKCGVGDNFKLKNYKMIDGDLKLTYELTKNNINIHKHSHEPEIELFKK